MNSSCKSFCKDYSFSTSSFFTSKNGSKAIKPIMSFIAIAETWIQTPAYILLGSDGVFDHIECPQMETITRLENPLIKKAEDLVNLAYTQGSKDNLSTLIIKI
jgi:serine/threonine protein phosphatase PrpC